MIGEGARIEPQMDVNQQGPKEPTFAPEKTTPLTKAASLAEQFQAEYGIPLSDVEKHYQVPIKDMQEARLLGGAYKSNMAPATASNVIPGAPSMNAGAVPSPTGQVPVGIPPTTPAMPEPTLTTAPAAPVVEVPVIAATESDVPAPKAEAPKSGVAPPEGMREQYSKGKKNPIGPSAFNHLANNLGFEKAKEVWESTYGKKNVPYEQYMSEYSKAAGKDMPGPRQPLPEGAKPGGAFGKPQYIPDYIKGGATPGGMAAAGGAALGAYLAAPSIENSIKSVKEVDT